MPPSASAPAAIPFIARQSLLAFLGHDLGWTRVPAPTRPALAAHARVAWALAPLTSAITPMIIRLTDFVAPDRSGWAMMPSIAQAISRLRSAGILIVLRIHDGSENAVLGTAGPEVEKN